MMRGIVSVVLLLLVALAGSATAARAYHAIDVSKAPWQLQSEQPLSGDLSLVRQCAGSRGVVADGLRQFLQHVKNAAARAISRVQTDSGHIESLRLSPRVMRRHFVNGTDPTAVCNDGTPGAHYHGIPMSNYNSRVHTN